MNKENKKAHVKTSFESTHKEAVPVTKSKRQSLTEARFLLF